MATKKEQEIKGEERLENVEAALSKTELWIEEHQKLIYGIIAAVIVVAGIIWGLDDNSKSLEPTIRETKCSKEPSKYDFEFQANSVAGSSGSPVYNKKGQLVGILYGSYSIAGGATKAIHAKFLKKLYEEEVNL